MQKKIIEELLKLSTVAFNKNEVPVAAIIVKENNIISKAYNAREMCKDVLGHAEIIAIRKANKKLKTWKLCDCDMYVTLKPCKMCQEIIKESRIKNVYYLLSNDKIINNNVNFIQLKMSINDKFKKLLTSFFLLKR